MPKGTEISDFWRRFTEMIGESVEVFQKDVLKAAGVGQSAVTKWKTGKDTPKLPRAIELATKYGVCVEWLLTGRGPKHPGDAQDPEMGQLLEFWGKLEPDTRQNILGYAKIQRSIQLTADPEHVREVHIQLSEANRQARAAGVPKQPK